MNTYTLIYPDIYLQFYMQCSLMCIGVTVEHYWQTLSASQQALLHSRLIVTVSIFIDHSAQSMHLSIILYKSSLCRTFYTFLNPQHVAWSHTLNGQSHICVEMCDCLNFAKH